MLVWQFVANGDVMKLGVEMALDRYWWQYVACC